MAGKLPFRSEYTKTFEQQVVELRKPELEHIRRAVGGLLWGITMNPEEFDVVQGNVRVGKTDPWTQADGAKIPRIRIFFIPDLEARSVKLLYIHCPPYLVMPAM